MIDQKLLQSLGNMAARNVCNKHPDLDIRFLVVKNGEMKAAIVPKGDKSGRTAHIHDLKPLDNVDPDAVKFIQDTIEQQLEQIAQEFRDMQNRA